MNPQATPITLATGQSITKNIVGKDGMGVVGPITGLQIYNIAGSNVTGALNTATQTVTFTAVGYGTTTFTFKAVNANNVAVYVDQQVINPTPIIVTVLEIN